VLVPCGIGAVRIVKPPPIDYPAPAPNGLKLKRTLGDCRNFVNFN
jgi:hypothetical protein